MAEGRRAPGAVLHLGLLVLSLVLLVPRQTYKPLPRTPLSLLQPAPQSPCEGKGSEMYDSEENKNNQSETNTNISLAGSHQVKSYFLTFKRYKCFHGTYHVIKQCSTIGTDGRTKW